MSIVANNMFRQQRFDDDVFSGKNDAERLTELLAVFERSNPRPDNNLNASSNDKKVSATTGNRVSNVSPPPGFSQLPSSSFSDSVWPNSKPIVSRNNSDVFPVDNHLPMMSSSNTSSMTSSSPPVASSNYTQSERKMLKELALLQRFMDRSATVSMGVLSPELSRFLAELDTEAAAESAPVGRYKTELCRPFEEHGTCKYGDKCQFAHGRAELRSLSRHPKYKTDLCKTYHTTGLCPYGPRCHFIHNDEEAAINRAGLERQRLERELKTRFEAFKQQEQQKQQQQLLLMQQQQQQQMIAAALLGNLEHKKLSHATPLRSSDFFLNPYSNLDNVRNASYAYDSLDSLTDKSSSLSNISSCDESLSSSPSLLMFNGADDEINNSLNSLISLNSSSSSSTCSSLDSNSSSSAPITPPLLSLGNNSSSPIAASSIQNRLSPYVSNNFASVCSNSSSSANKSPSLGMNQATPGFGRFNAPSGILNRESYDLDFVHRSEAVQEQIFRLAWQLARSMNAASSSSTVNCARL